MKQSEGSWRRCYSGWYPQAEQSIMDITMCVETDLYYTNHGGLNMREMIDALAKILEPIGGRGRHFIVNYRDDNNNYFNIPVSMFQPPGVHLHPEEIQSGLIDPLEAKGYTVYFAVELLDGYTNEQLEALSKKDSLEVSKHIDIIYYDAGKEVA